MSATRTQGGRPGAVGSAEMGGCCHHWVIEPANGEMSGGECRRCGARRMFFNADPLLRAVWGLKVAQCEVCRGWFPRSEQYFGVEHVSRLKKLLSTCLACEPLDAFSRRHTVTRRTLLASATGRD